MTDAIVVSVRPIEADGEAETELVFRDCERVTVHGSMHDGQLCLALHGHRRGGGKQVESGILDVLDDDAVANDVPRDADGRSAALAALLD
jgi:hypothetical protein